MKHSTIIDTTMAFVKEILKNAEGGHDWFHIERVFKNTFSVELSYCLHHSKPLLR